MSGGGGGDDTWRPAAVEPPRGSGSGGGAGDGGGDDPCAIHEITTINSPNRAALAGIRTGNILALKLDMGPPRRLLAHATDGQIAGSITSRSLAQLIRCMQDGVVYGLEVLSLRGAVCQVRISRI